MQSQQYNIQGFLQLLNGYGGSFFSQSDIFFECLKNEKVEVIFGYPGGANIKIYENNKRDNKD